MKTFKVIKDSGNRREFETGAVRDIQEGKGRCDLLPLDVVANLFKYDITMNSDKKAFAYSIIKNIDEFKNNNSNIDCLYKVLNDFSKTHYFNMPTMILEVSVHFENGAKKYGEYNWQKGIPVNFYVDSAVRHFLKYLRGDNDEPHDNAFVWNIMCCIWEVTHNDRGNNKRAESKNTEISDIKLS